MVEMSWSEPVLIGANPMSLGAVEMRDLHDGCAVSGPVSGAANQMHWHLPPTSLDAELRFRITRRAAVAAGLQDFND